MCVGTVKTGTASNFVGRGTGDEHHGKDTDHMPNSAMLGADVGTEATSINALPPIMTDGGTD